MRTVVEMYQFFTVIGMLAAGFGWLIHQMNGLDDRIRHLETRVNAIETRLSILETILGMMGMPIKHARGD